MSAIGPRCDTSRLPIAAVRKVYSITSSAMESTAFGTSMPSARALAGARPRSNIHS
jgi:hypothetical protein